MNRYRIRKTTLVLLALLFLEVALVHWLRELGWYGTGTAIKVLAGILVAVLPVLIACVMLATNRLRFSLRSLLVAMALIAVFLAVSLKPLLDHRSARRASMRLIAANAIIMEFDWDFYYAVWGLEPPPTVAPADANRVPPWLAPLTNSTLAMVSDSVASAIWLSNDEQCRILADNWQRFPSLQYVGIDGGVSTEGLSLLQMTLPRFEHLGILRAQGENFPPDWFRCVPNVRLLYFGAGTPRGRPFPSEHLADIASLPNLEVLMARNYVFKDEEARRLAASTSIKLVYHHGTAVNEFGEIDLSAADLKRLVERD